MDDLPKCYICLESILENMEYGRIDIPGETTDKYHIQCLDTWISTRHKSIINREEISSYWICKNGTDIRKINVEYTVIDCSDSTPLIQNQPENVQSNKCINFCAIFLLCLLVILVFVPILSAINY